MSPEWQYLFTEAGVSEAMLKDKATLQFILDTVYEIGGAPPKLQTISGKFNIIICHVLCPCYYD